MSVYVKCAWKIVMLNYSLRVVAVLLVLFAAAAVDPTDEELRARIVRTSLLEEAVLLGVISSRDVSDGLTVSTSFAALNGTVPAVTLLRETEWNPWLHGTYASQGTADYRRISMTMRHMPNFLRVAEVARMWPTNFIS